MVCTKLLLLSADADILGSSDSEKVLIVGKGFEDIICAEFPSDVIKVMLRGYTIMVDYGVGCGGGTSDGRGGGTVL